MANTSVTPSAAILNNRAVLKIPKDMKKRIAELRKQPGYGNARHSKSVMAYGVGCDDGRAALIPYLRGLMECHPDVYGGRLQCVLLDAAGLESAGDKEDSYRRGWIVGIVVALECLLYDLAKGRITLPVQNS